MLPHGDSFRVQAAKAGRGSKGGKLAAKRTKAGRSFREGAEREGEGEGEGEDFNGRQIEWPFAGDVRMRHNKFPSATQQYWVG
jgi:hypothetical protein